MRGSRGNASRSVRDGHRSATGRRYDGQEGVDSYEQLPYNTYVVNGKGLLFEFSFGQLNTAKGEKRLLPKEAFDEAAREKIARPKTRSLKVQLLLALECRQKLMDFTALTRKDIAQQLDITTARLNQILDLLRLPPGIQEQILRRE